MDNRQKIIDYFFKFYQIELTDFHEKNSCVDYVTYTDTRANKAAVIRHTIIKFNFEEHRQSNVVKVFVKYMYESDGSKSGLTFNDVFLKNKMKLGQKCVSVLDKQGVNHYYPAMQFTIEMNKLNHSISITDCSQSITIIKQYGTFAYSLEYIVNEIVCKQLESWNINTTDIELTDLIDMYFMAKI